MTDVTCPNCNNTNFYYNTEGITIDGICISCKTPIKIPFISAKNDQVTVDIKCDECGETNSVSFLPYRRTFRKGSQQQREQKLMLVEHHTKIFDTVCKECGADLDIENLIGGTEQGHVKSNPKKR